MSIRDRLRKVHAHSYCVAQNEWVSSESAVPESQDFHVEAQTRASFGHSRYPAPSFGFSIEIWESENREMTL